MNKELLHYVVTRYGGITSNYRLKIGEKYDIRINHYNYMGRYFIEYWCNGVLIIFNKLV